MAIEEAIFTMLSVDSGVRALLVDRVYPVETPENGELPAVAYFRVSSPNFYTHDTAPGVPILAGPRFQFDCKAKDKQGSPPGAAYDVARSVAAALAAVMRGFRGTVEGIEIRGIFELDDRDMYDPQTKIYIVQKDFQIWHVEA